MKKFFAAATVVGSVFALSACDVQQTKEGEMPDVDVEGGALPEYNVDTADVDVTTEERTVEVPVIKVEEADAGDPAQ